MGQLRKESIGRKHHSLEQKRPEQKEAGPLRAIPRSQEGNGPWQERSHKENTAAAAAAATEGSSGR